MIFILVVLASVAGLGIGAIFGWGSGYALGRKTGGASRREAGRLESALRKIANGAGAPLLEAQIALDELEQTRYKDGR